MEATLKVIIGISDPLEKLAHKALEVLGQRSAHSSPGYIVTEPLMGPQTQPQPEPVAEIQTQPQPEPQPEPQLEPEPQPEPEIETAVPEEVQPEDVPSAIPDDQTMRTMMDIAISKWAGVGSENSKDPKVLTMRKDVCNAFKQIARHLGAEKPTKLQGDARNAFLKEIEDNLYCEDGRVVWRAF
ncbi:MAG: hypothetical protein HDS35_01020 [Bacteroides sp.]|nr:hypothetical protein [Bacteroides sp.]